MKTEEEDPYNILYDMGVILLVPHLAAGVLFFLMILQSILSGTPVSIGIDGGAYGIGASILSGFIAIICATIKMRRRRRQNLRREGE